MNNVINDSEIFFKILAKTIAAVKSSHLYKFGKFIGKIQVIVLQLI